MVEPLKQKDIPDSVLVFLLCWVVDLRQCSASQKNWSLCFILFHINRQHSLRIFYPPPTVSNSTLLEGGPHYFLAFMHLNLNLAYSTSRGQGVAQRRELRCQRKQTWTIPISGSHLQECGAFKPLLRHRTPGVTFSFIFHCVYWLFISCYIRMYSCKYMLHAELIYPHSSTPFPSSPCLLVSIVPSRASFLLPCYTYTHDLIYLYKVL